jgi:hypothetical protein
VWVYGALSVRDGHALTQTALARNTTGYLAFLQTLDRTYSTGDLYLIADNLASHTSGPSPYPACLHSGRSGMVEFDRGVVAGLPTQSLRRTILGR